jgi:hypothetical protein
MKATSTKTAVIALLLGYTGAVIPQADVFYPSSGQVSDLFHNFTLFCR